MTTILIKKKDTAGAPAAGDLTNAAGGAEIAVNTATKRLYTKDSGGTVVELGTNPSALTTNLLFSPDATYDIGASGATRPRDMYLSRNLTVGGTLTLAGGVNLNGNVTVGDSSADTLTINSTITSNLIFTDNTYDIGASGATRPRTLYLGTSLITPAITNSGLTSGRVTYAGTAGLLQDSANLTFNGTTLTANTIGAFTLGGTIAGGGNQINNVIIGTTTPLAGAFTTLSATGQITGRSSNGAVFVTSNGSDADFVLSLASALVTQNVTGSLQLQTGGSNRAVISSTGLAVTGVLSATGVVSGLNFSAPATGFSVGPATDSFQTGFQIFGSGSGGNAYKVVTLANNVAVTATTSTGFAVNGDLSATGFQFKLGTSGNSQVTIVRGARPSVGSAGVQIYGGASATVNDAAPAAYITLGSGALGDTYEGGVGYHAYGNTTGSGFQNAHTWYRRTSVDTISQTMQISPTGVLDIGTGAGAVGQIKFPIAQVTSSDVNTLDDYEEGTYTPELTSTGASFTYPRGQYGSYVKIGSLVYAQFYIGADATGTTSNQCVISGLPFNSANLNALAQAGATAWVSQSTSLGYTKNNNDAIINIWQQNIGSASVATAAQVAGGYIVGTIMYRAT